VLLLAFSLALSMGLCICLFCINAAYRENIADLREQIELKDANLREQLQLKDAELEETRQQAAQWSTTSDNVAKSMRIALEIIQNRDASGARVQSPPARQIDSNKSDT